MFEAIWLLTGLATGYFVSAQMHAHQLETRCTNLYKNGVRAGYSACIKLLERKAQSFAGQHGEAGAIFGRAARALSEDKP